MITDKIITVQVKEKNTKKNINYVTSYDCVFK